MAGPTVLQIKRTTITGRVPNTTVTTNSQYINTGELALNLTDQKMFTSNGTVYFEIGSNTTNQNVTNNFNVGTAFIANTSGVYSNVGFSITQNNQRLTFATVNAAAYSYFIQQNDDNFVFYTTNGLYGARAVWSIYANSSTSNLNFSVRTVHSGGLSIPSGVTILDSTGSQGTAGQVLTSNGAGNVYWSSASNQASALRIVSLRL